MVALLFLVSIALAGVGVFAYLQFNELKEEKRQHAELHSEYLALQGRDDYAEGYKKGAKDVEDRYEQLIKFLKSNYSDLIGVAMGFVENTSKRNVMENAPSFVVPDDLEAQIINMPPPKHAKQVSPVLLTVDGTDDFNDVFGSHV